MTYRKEEGIKSLYSLLKIPENIEKEVNELSHSFKNWFKRKYQKGGSPQNTDVLESVYNRNIDPCIKLYNLSKGRGKRKWERDLLLQCVYKHYGSAGVKALLLNQILDYIRKVRSFDSNEILKRIDNKFGDVIEISNWISQKEGEEISKATSEVLNFVKKNITQILNKDVEKKSI